jgi:hypothetical protein
MTWGINRDKNETRFAGVRDARAVWRGGLVRGSTGDLGCIIGSQLTMSWLSLGFL